VSHCVIEGVQTGLFPAEAGPTVEWISSGRTDYNLGWTQSVPGCIPTQSVGTIKTGSPASRLLQFRVVPALVGPASHCVIEGVQTGLFPASAGPTESTADTCRTGFSREAVALLLIRF
jgi:hypothetical protein